MLYSHITSRIEASPVLLLRYEKEWQSSCRRDIRRAFKRPPRDPALPVATHVRRAGFKLSRFSIPQIRFFVQINLNAKKIRYYFDSDFELPTYKYLINTQSQRRAMLEM